MPSKAAFGLIVAVGLLMAWPTSGAAQAQQQTGLSMYVARKLEAVWPYNATRRWQSYVAVTKVAEALVRGKGPGTEIATDRTKTFPDYPLLVLTDKDGNGRADIFAYHQTKVDDFTREFGVFLTHGSSRKPYWIVFNGGLVPRLSKSGKVLGLVWYNHQFIDRNEDGAFDVYIANDVDPEGSGLPDGRGTVWILDDNFDGKVDRVEYNIAGKAQEVTPTADGVFELKRPLAAQSKPIRKGDPIASFADAIAADIAHALGAGRKSQ